MCIRDRFGVQEWDKAGATVVGRSCVRGSNAAAVADPRFPEKAGRHISHFRVTPYGEPSVTVTGATHVANGAPNVADPRIVAKGANFAGSPGLYGVSDWGLPSPAVTGSVSVSSSNTPGAVADPRLKDNPNRHSNIMRVVGFKETSPCVTGTRFGSGAQATADPRVGEKEYYARAYAVDRRDAPARTVTGGCSPSNGGICVADDVRIGHSPRQGSYRILKMDETSPTVVGSAYVGTSNGPQAVADHRVPGSGEAPEPPPIIVSADGTWHRPLTTMELFALQSFPVRHLDGSPVVLSGKNDSSWRERIGNAVPPDASRGVHEVILLALVQEAVGMTMILDDRKVWVRRSAGLRTGEISPCVKLLEAGEA